DGPRRAGDRPLRSGEGGRIAAMNVAPRPKVAYVAYAFPVLTQTFTVREVAALRRRELDLVVFAARTDPASRLDPEAADEAARAVFLAPSAAVLAWFFRRPLRFVTKLATCRGRRYRHRAAPCRLTAPPRDARRVDQRVRPRASRARMRTSPRGQDRRLPRRNPPRRVERRAAPSREGPRPLGRRPAREEGPRRAAARRGRALAAGPRRE